ncbi:lysine-specific demethylase 4A-like [Aphelenchoides avenae]|nr:lysine-specific demethylase 4A-like [Aphelenchus avenae]
MTLVLGWDELQRHRGAVKIPASSCRDFNLGQLGSMLDHMPMTPGVTTPYLYVSMKATSAPWHVEDGRLFSVFYLHAGNAHKFWYSVPASYSRQFEELLNELCPFLKDRCNPFLDYKEILIAPELLRQRGIPVNVLGQLESTYVLTLADVYHSVLNSGYGIGIAINFAMESWFPIGKQVRLQQMYCMDDVCEKLVGSNPDGTSKDDFYYVDAEGCDGTKIVVRMSRRRAVVHVETRFFDEL